MSIFQGYCLDDLRMRLVSAPQIHTFVIRKYAAMRHTRFSIERSAGHDQGEEGVLCLRAGSGRKHTFVFQHGVHIVRQLRRETTRVFR